MINKGKKKKNNKYYSREQRNFGFILSSKKKKFLSFSLSFLSLSLSFFLLTIKGRKKNTYIYMIHGIGFVIIWYSLNSSKYSIVCFFCLVNPFIIDNRE